PGRSRRERRQGRSRRCCSRPCRRCRRRGELGSCGPWCPPKIGGIAETVYAHLSGRLEILLCSAVDSIVRELSPRDPENLIQVRPDLATAGRLCHAELGDQFLTGRELSLAVMGEEHPRHAGHHDRLTLRRANTRSLSFGVSPSAFGPERPHTLTALGRHLNRYIPPGQTVLAEQRRSLQRDRPEAAETPDRDQDGLPRGILSGRVHARVVEVDEFDIGGGACVLGLEQLTGTLHELRPTIVRTVARHSRSPVE